MHLYLRQQSECIETYAIQADVRHSNNYYGINKYYQNLSVRLSQSLQKFTVSLACEIHENRHLKAEGYETFVRKLKEISVDIEIIAKHAESLI